jgi:hypothetical protein
MRRWRRPRRALDPLAGPVAPATLPSSFLKQEPVMKNLAKIAIALGTVVSCAAFAQTSTDADQARRDRNMNEVLTRHHVNLDDANVQRMPESDSRSTSSAHRAAEKTREESHKVAQSTRNFTHKHLQKLRAFSSRQDAAFQTKNNRPAEKMSAGEASKS